MPLPKPLPALQQDLRNLLIDDLAAALKALLELLPAGTEKHHTATTLLGKLNDTNKARLRGTISNGDLQLAYNQLRSDLLDLIDVLEESDFDPNAALPQAPKGKRGEILYRIPDTMVLGRETPCLIRIALDAEAIVENLTLDEHVTLKELARVSDLMQVELLDPTEEPAFSIRSLSSAEQMVEEEGYTEWLFRVKPLRAGTFPLMIKVAVIELLLGKERKKEIVLEEIVRITAEATEPVAEATLKTAGESLVFRETPPERSDSGVRGLEDAEPKYAEADLDELFAPPPAAPPAPAPAMPQPSPVFTPPPPSFPEAQAPPAKRVSGRGLRGVAVLLAFVVFSAGAAWALAPQEAAWVWTRYVDDTPEAYTRYVEKYQDSRHREKAVFRKAWLTRKPADLQNYLTEYPDGKFLSRVQVSLDSLEQRDFERLRRDPDTSRIREFLQTYPASKRLEAVKDVIDSARAMPQDQLRLDVQKRIEERNNRPGQQRLRDKR